MKILYQGRAERGLPAFCVALILGNPGSGMGMHVGCEVIPQGVVMQYFDSSGRFLTQNRHYATHSVICETVIQKTGIDYMACLKRIPSPLSSLLTTTREELAWNAFKIRASLMNNSALSNVLNGPCLPVLLPCMEIGDYGLVLDSIYLRAVTQVCLDARRCPRLRHGMAGRLAKRITQLPETRHTRLVSLMRHNSVVGLYFPLAFHGFAVAAARQCIQQLPSNFLLSGGLDTAMAMVMHPEVMFSRQGLSFTMPAVQWEDGQSELYFMTYGSVVIGDVGIAPHACSGDFTAGLLVIEDNQ